MTGSEMHAPEWVVMERPEPSVPDTLESIGYALTADGYAIRLVDQAYLIVSRGGRTFTVTVRELAGE
jgi:hypothetical protein